MPKVSAQYTAPLIPIVPPTTMTRMNHRTLASVRPLAAAISATTAAASKPKPEDAARVVASISARTTPMTARETRGLGLRVWGLGFGVRG